MHTMKNKTYSLDFVLKLGIITKNMNDIQFKECPIFISLTPYPKKHPCPSSNYMLS
jgi:hypothetical protein